AEWISRHLAVWNLQSGTSTKAKNIGFHEKIWKSLFVSLVGSFFCEHKGNPLKKKKTWAIKVNRLDENEKLWIAGKHALLCEKDQYENHRKDGRRLPKRHAVPTLFSRRPAPKRRCSGPKTGHRNNCERIDPTLDHSYATNLSPMTSMQPSTENGDDCKSTNGDEDKETSGPVFRDFGILVCQPLSPKSKQINELKSRLHNALHRFKRVQKSKKDLYEEIRKLKSRVNTQSTNIKLIFNRDQMKTLGNVSTREIKWQNNKIRKAL
ncbi:uncharacterized protein LOC111632657, partial [Centruroides sculpturatus]|uniref:uncharacterized protein LOC111632657 n=1 Tax=Centruroides sculpturatus TaxID=218467 RepID=UPI000C6E007B